MPELNISRATTAEREDIFDDYEIAALNTDAATGTKETEWMNSRWAQQWGIFNATPDLKTALLLKAYFIMGKGYECDAETKVILDHIRGWGKDNIDDIFLNLLVASYVGGDAYAEIIRADDGTIINLKCLDPGSIKIIVDSKGMLKRYEQVNKVEKSITKFKPEDILHICNHRIADQIHGLSYIDSLETTIKANEENFEDTRRMAQLDSKPFIIFKLKTDSASKIAEIETKIKRAINQGTFMCMPDDENIISYEVVKITPGNSAFQFEDMVRSRFFRAIMLPQIVPGGAGLSSESESKVIYLAFEGIVEREQRSFEKQLWNQLFLKVDFNSPATMQAELQTDTAKDGAMNMLNFQPNDTEAGVGRGG
jgi:hypothetical protein